MYAETDFLLALIKDEDWLGTAAETVYREHQDDLWTSQFTLIELLIEGQGRNPPFQGWEEADTLGTESTTVTWTDSPVPS